ncbi:MAG TPA: hypothetical protein DC058_07835 [Planctomycetaceae bacterium]|jgi:hypothetical protein|nr:hypothetical protein [Planctomycetaceae bacterium]HBC61116.1 hypothetical protein [Planctomycetaceae bacterium]
MGRCYSSARAIRKRLLTAGLKTSESGKHHREQPVFTIKTAEKNRILRNTAVKPAELNTCSRLAG